jgi:long-subunit fatty acid transport protein
VSLRARSPAFFAAAASFASFALLMPRVARATSVEEFPDNGSEQEGRGGAWVARASDPLAAFYNPSGLAGQPTRLTAQANFSAQRTCFARVQAAGDQTNDGFDGAYPKVCNAGSVFPDPQLAFTLHVNGRVGIGLAFLGPSAVGSAGWPQFVDGNPSPQRYLLISSSSLLLTPTLAVGWEAIDGVRLGASLIFGTAPSLDFVDAVPAINELPANAQDNDIRSELKAKGAFFPGFTLGALWSPSDDLDVAVWYKWMSAVRAKGDVITSANAFTPAAASGNTSAVEYGDTAEPYCYTLPSSPPAPLPPRACGNGDNASVKVPIPMEAKLGLRYHRPRATDVARDPHLRDPVAQDVFDLEVDLTWANDSAFDALQVRFPGDANGNGLIPANPGIPTSFIPPNADVRHGFRDVVGVRVGGDYDVVPDTLALRAGAFFETQAANSVYQNIDFDGAARIGLALGMTYRVHLGSEKHRALDLMLGYGHVFFGTLHDDDPHGAGLGALAGTQCLNGASGGPSTCQNGAQPYRTPWPVNLGTITSSIDVVNVGASYQF